MVGAHLGYTHTLMTARLEVDKADPAGVVTPIWDAVAAGDHEVLADQVSRDVRAALSSPVETFYPSFV